jgi:hypothetical protein
MKSPILGSSYVARSVNAADDRMINLFPEIVPQGGKEPAFLTRAPGLTAFKVIPGISNSIRGLYNLYGVIYVVRGPDLYSMAPPAYTPVLRGTAITSASLLTPVVIADNGTQIFIAGDDFNGYVYNVNTTVFTKMVPGVYANFPGCTSVAFVDGFFLINKPNTQRVYASTLYDGTTWDPLAFASAEKSSDNVVGVAALHGELWVFGTNSTEVWANTGNAGFAFSPIPGAFSEIGCLSIYTVAKMDNTIYWLGIDSRGAGVVYRAKGYTGQRVSTHAVEWQIQQLSLDNACSYTYQQDGHSFYVLNTHPIPRIDLSPTTWVYDVATESWHERKSYDTSSGIYLRHWGSCQCTVKLSTGVQSVVSLIGDVRVAAVYYFDLLNFTDSGTAQLWLRSWRALPTGQNNLNRTVHHSLQLDCETNQGLGTQPECQLRFSDDGGNNWSNYRFANLGLVSDLPTRVIWRRLGMTLALRDRVYEVSGTDPVKISIMGAELHMSNTNA